MSGQTLICVEWSSQGHKLCCEPLCVQIIVHSYVADSLTNPDKPTSVLFKNLGLLDKLTQCFPSLC